LNDVGDVIFSPEGEQFSTLLIPLFEHGDGEVFSTLTEVVRIFSVISAMVIFVGANVERRLEGMVVPE
jgi:hypothetical protein